MVDRGEKEHRNENNLWTRWISLMQLFAILTTSSLFSLGLLQVKYAMADYCNEPDSKNNIGAATLDLQKKKCVPFFFNCYGNPTFQKTVFLDEENFVFPPRQFAFGCSSSCGGILKLPKYSSACKRAFNNFRLCGVEFAKKFSFFLLFLPFPCFGGKFHMEHKTEIAAFYCFFVARKIVCHSCISLSDLL